MLGTGTVKKIGGAGESVWGSHIRGRNVLYSWKFINGNNWTGAVAAVAAAPSVDSDLPRELAGTDRGKSGNDDWVARQRLRRLGEARRRQAAS